MCITVLHSFVNVGVISLWVKPPSINRSCCFPQQSTRPPGQHQTSSPPPSVSPWTFNEKQEKEKAMEGEECLTEVQRNLTKQPQTINVNDNKNGNKDLSDRVQMVDSLANWGPPGPPQEIKNLTNAERLGRCCLRVSPNFSKFSQRICDLNSGE